VLSPLMVALVLFLPLGEPGASRAEKPEDGKWEFKAAYFGIDEKENTTKLNALSAEGWEYVGPLGNGMVAFKRRLVELLARQVRRIEWPNNHIFHTAFSRDGRFYLGGGDTGTLRIWETASGKQLHELPIVIGLFTPDGKHILGPNGGKTLFLFDLTSGKEVRNWEASEAIVSLAIGPDGKQVVSGHADKSLRLWDFATGKEIRKFEGHTEPANVSISADGKQILSASGDKTVRLWDAETGKLLRTFEDLKEMTPIEGLDLIVQAFFLPGGRQIAAYVWGGKDNLLLILDAATGRVVRKHDLGADHHKDLTISADGRWFLTGHGDKTVRLRELTTGRELHRFEVADVGVPRALSFSPDGRFAVAGSHRGWVYLWQLR